MKFYTETAISGDIIFTKTNILTPPPCPVIAQSTPPAPPAPPALIRLANLALYLLGLVISLRNIHWPPLIWTHNQARFTVLAIVALALVEVLAQGYIETSLGVMVCNYGHHCL